MGLTTSQPPQKAAPTAVTSTTPSDDDEDDELVPSLFTWNFGGQSVYVTGSWDGWVRKTPLRRRTTADAHCAVLLLPTGPCSFKFYVDGNWRCNPTLETRTDERGNTNNSVVIVRPTPETPTASPQSSYSSITPADLTETDVPVLPRHLTQQAAKRGTRHVRNERLFDTVGEDPAVRTMAMQSRYRAKIITTVFVTPV